MSRQGNGQYPRDLSSQEHSLLGFVLPSDRPGYRAYRDSIRDMVVLGEGRRGKGNLILGRPGVQPDWNSPLPPVIALGVIETENDELTISVRESTDEQIDVEFVMHHSNGIPSSFIECRRYTYSDWLPGQPSPRSGNVVRQVAVSAETILVIAADDQRMWVHDSASGMNLLLPITSFYAELMGREKIRAPEVALKPSRFFQEHERYSDESLRRAFCAYNLLYPKVSLSGSEQPESRPSFGNRIRRALGLEKTDG